MKVDQSQQRAVRDRWSRIALSLVGGTLTYNIIEAVIALWSGGIANSVALLGFGLDSLIETSAAALLLWRLLLQTRGADAEVVERMEHRVHRFVGATFFVLAVYVIGQSAWTLWHRSPPQESTIGIVLAVASLVIMPLTAVFKLKAAKILDSRALRAEAKETIACSYLSFTLLLGLGTHAFLGWWWADPAAAILMVPWLVHEGKETWQGEECADD